MWIFNFNLSLILPKESNTLEPLWTLEPIPLITNSQAMFLGLILGIVAAKFKPNEANIIAEKLKIFVDKILYVLIFIIPLFVIGFIIKLQYDGSLQMIAKDYTSIFIIVALAQSSYILFLYFILSNYKIKDCLYNLKNMLPAALAGFSTMSSAASIPMTIIGTESNLKNKSLASSIIPITVNIHLIGDCFAIPIFAYAILRNYGISEPSLINYLIFTFYFILAKFSIAAVPGGGIIVMLPILEHYLGFNAEMMSLITALYILFDPVVTCTNVLGNGALTKLIDKIYTR
jgi:Na+/H+-dicarboxylate symporter